MVTYNNVVIKLDPVSEEDTIKGILSDLEKNDIVYSVSCKKKSVTIRYSTKDEE